MSNSQLGETIHNNKNICHRFELIMLNFRQIDLIGGLKIT